MAVLAAGSVLCGCAENPQDENGMLRISFSTDAAVDGVGVTRAGEGLEGLEDLLPAREDFCLTIESGDGSVNEWDRVDDFPAEGIWLDPGVYTASAFIANDEVEEGFDCPRFGVTAPFTIIYDETTPIDLTAKLLNMAVTVEYTPEFLGYFPETHDVVIRRGENVLADFSEQPTGSVAAFIEPEPFTVSVSCVRQNGNPYSREFEIDATRTEEFGPCTHQRIILGVNEGAVGNVSVTVTFDDTVETIEVGPVEVGEDE